MRELISLSKLSAHTRPAKVCSRASGESWLNVAEARRNPLEPAADVDSCRRLALVDNGDNKRRGNSIPAEIEEFVFDRLLDDPTRTNRAIQQLARCEKRFDIGETSVARIRRKAGIPSSRRARRVGLQQSGTVSVIKRSGYCELLPEDAVR